jgi:hypothetical protein
MIRGRPFEPGNKLGRGRPRGSQNKRNTRGQQLLDQYSETIMQKALAEAIKGDVSLLRTFLSFLLRRPGDRPIQTGPLPMSSLDELAKSSAKVLQKVTSGKLSPGEARNLTDLIEDRRRVLETEELEKRVRALEQLPESED